MIESSTVSAAELKVSMDRLARKLDFLFKHLRIEYPDESVPVYVLEAQELVRVGRDSEAMKIVREHTAVGIIEARAIIDDMIRRVGRADGTVAPIPQAAPVFEERPHGEPALDQAAIDAAWRDAIRAAEASR